MERKLSHPKLGKRIICREGEVVSVYTDGLTQLEEMVCKSELTAKAYEHFILLYHADLGYKPAS